jgi:hypothetical protein
VFVAGDARATRYRQITTAVADGTVAALGAIELVTELARPVAVTRQPPTTDRPQAAMPS